MKKLVCILSGAIVVLALVSGAFAVRSREMDSRPSDGAASGAALLPSPPETYWYAYINLSWGGSYRHQAILRDPPPDTDILSFASKSTNQIERTLAIKAILITDRERMIPLATVLATNGMVDAEARRSGLYSWIDYYILNPSYVPDWNSRTSSAFLDYCRWAVDNENTSSCQAGAARVLLDGDPEWRTSDHRRSVLLRWLANAKSDSQREFLQSQLDTMYNPPPPPPEPGKYLEIQIIE